ncbi:MucBP domain-containing protein, partial [Anaerococcus prevotii]
EHFVGTWVFEEDKTPEPETNKGNVYVEYVAEDGTPLDKKLVVKKDAPVGEAYTTELKTFNGYEFARMADDSAPANGEVQKGEQHVTYVYKKTEVTPPVEEKGNVYVEYVAEDGTVLDKQSVVKKDAPVGDHYTTELRTFNGYEFARMADGSAPANGEVQKGEQHVTYVYKKTEVTPPVEEIGSVYVRYITEDGATLEDYTPVKKDVPVGENYTTEQKAFNGYVFKGMSADSAGANGNVINGDLYVTYVYKLPETPEVDPEGEKGNVYVNYITVDRETLANDVVKENAPVGEAYTTEQITFDGYEFVKMGDGSADANGNVQKGDQYVTYVYKPIETPQVKTGNVYVKYVTEDGTVLDQQSVVKENAPVGDHYTTEQKAFDGYEFTRMGDGSADANGNVQEGDQFVTYVYKPIETPQVKTGNVYVKYVTEDGKVLEEEKAVQTNAKVGTKYTTEPKTFDGYEFTRMGDGSADANGNIVEGDLHVVYVYREKSTPKPPTPGVDKITKFVDENGNKISKSTKGDNPKKDIDGYEFVKTEKDKDG